MQTKKQSERATPEVRLMQCLFPVVKTV